MKNLIDRERLRENRNRIAEKNKAGGPKDTKAAPAKGDGRGNPNRKGSPSRGRSQERSKGEKFAISSRKASVTRGHAQGKCRRGDKCFYKHDDKAAAATKDTKRTTSPAPKKKGKESNAAPCLIDPHPKFACIAKKQPRVTSSSEGSSVSMKRVRFRKIPQVIEVRAV